MNSLLIFGQIVPPWASHWLTPVWLLGLGVAIGLAAVLALWGLIFLLSQVPGLGQLAENRDAQRTFVGIGTLVLLVAYFWYGISSLPGADDAKSVGQNPWVNLLLLSPICWLIPYAFSVLVNRRTVREIPLTIEEGPLKPIGWVIIALACCSLLGFVAVRNPGDFFHSLSRLPHARTKKIVEKVPAAPLVDGKALDDADLPLHAVKYSFLRDELRQIEYHSTENVELLLHAPTPEDPLGRSAQLEVPANAKLPPWQPHRQNVKSLFPEPEVREVLIRNLSAKEATVTLTFVTAAPIGQVAMIPVVAVAIFFLIMAYVLQSTLMPRISAIALSTFKSEAAQPLFLILLIVGVVMLFLFVVIPYNTFGEDIKMLKDAGVKWILVLSIVQAVWGASTSIAEEVEGRTALTVLSKPVNRSSFIIGKFLGIAWTVAVMYVIFSAVFMAIVAYKPLYDEREGGFDAKEYGRIGYGLESPTWEICHLEMTSVVPGLALGFMETIVLTAISVAISTRLPMLANFVICFTIYVLGNLTPMIVKAAIPHFEIVSFVGQLIATIVPNLETFDIQAALASGQLVPPLYLWMSLIYCLIYTLIAMLLALFLFEDRDLA